MPHCIEAPLLPFCRCPPAPMARSPRGLRRTAGLLLLTPALAVAACSDSGADRIASPPVTTSQVRLAVTGTAASSLRADGTFNLVAPRTTTGAPELTAAQARALAEVFAHRFAPMMSKGLDKERGRAIAYQQLHQCGRVFYAQSSYQPLPDTAPRFLRLTLGPQWLVSLCDGGGPALSVAVAALATDVRLERGRLLLPASSGGEFSPTGIPAGRSEELLPPEWIVVEVAARTGQRASAVPELFATPFRRGRPQNSTWRVRLEQPTELRTAAATTVITSTVYMRPLLTRASGFALLVANDAQRQFEEINFPPMARIGEPLEAWKARVKDPWTTVRVERRSDVPLNFTSIP